MSETRKVIIFTSVCLIGIGIGIFFLKDKKPVSVQIEDKMAALQVAIEDWYAEKGSPPDSLDQLGLPEEEIQDIIKKDFLFSVSEDGETVTIQTLGADAKPGGKMFNEDRKRVFTMGKPNGLDSPQD